MKKQQQASSPFFKTPIFQKLAKTLVAVSDADLIPQQEVTRKLRKAEKVMDAKVKAEVQKVTKQLQEQTQLQMAAMQEETTTKVQQSITEQIAKEAQYKKNEALRYRVPFNRDMGVNPDRKWGADVTSSFLRRMAILYPIARACINRRVRQITQLEWDITTIDDIEGENGFDSQIGQVKAFFKRPSGMRSRLRKLLTVLVDDILTIDAACFEIARLRGGQFDYDRGLKPVDPSTIVLLIDEQGGTPEPPDAAYKQIIQNKVIADFTLDEMIYETMTNRSYNPYGLAPLESLILQAESALRGTMYNLNYFREGNTPEGFLTLPEDVAANKEQVEEWQVWFDAIMAGDPRMIRRLKILPNGSTYTAAKKPEDMAFERFELWLLQQTCAVFEVQPQDIGITLHVNRATGESQGDIARERGLYPLANFIKEIFDEIIQEVMGYEQLQFIWHNLNPVDRKEEAEIAEIEIRNGALGVDEWRLSQGRTPIGLKPYVMTSSGPVLVDDIVNGSFKPSTVQPENTDANDQTDPAKEEQKEIKAWRKAVLNDLKHNRPVRKAFEVHFMAPEIHKAIAEALGGVTSSIQARLLFNQFLDPEVKQSFKLLKMAETFRMIEKADFDE